MSARLRRAQAPPAPHLHPCPTPSRRGRWGARQDADAGMRGCTARPPHRATWGCVPIHVCASWSSELGGALPVLPVGTSCLLLTEDAPPGAPLRGPAALGAPAPGPPGARRPGPGPQGSQCGRWSYCCVEAKRSFQKLSRRFCVPRTQQQQQGSQEILPAQSLRLRGIAIQTSGGLC